MKILSIDVGIINLAYCILNEEKVILHWEVITLCNGTVIENCYDMIKQFNERKHLLDIDTLLIEKQPSVNPKMRVMAQSIRSYFMIKSIDYDKKIKIIDWSPKHKLKCYDGPVPEWKVKSEYSKRKKTAVFQCKQLVNLQSLEMQNKFDKERKKKDDLADSFLQGLSYIMFNDSKKKNSSVIIQRAPTSKQKKYNKYSKNNLKFLVIQELNSRNFQKRQINLQDFMETRISKNIKEILEEWIGKKEISKSINRLYAENKDINIIKEELVPKMFWEMEFS